MKLSRLTATDCKYLLGQITATSEKTLTSNAETEVKLCKQKFYSDLEVKFPRPDSMDIMKDVKYFDTQLSTNSKPPQTLTLRNCRVLKTLFIQSQVRVTRIYFHIKYIALLYLHYHLLVAPNKIHSLELLLSYRFQFC